MRCQKGDHRNGRNGTTLNAWKDCPCHRGVIGHRAGGRHSPCQTGRWRRPGGPGKALDDVVRIITAGGGDAHMPTDVRDPAQCQQAVALAVEGFGGIDILVCSAGLSLRGYFEGTALDVLENVMRINFFGTLYCSHFALPHVKEHRGSLVAVSSLTGKHGVARPTPFTAPARRRSRVCTKVCVWNWRPRGSTSASWPPPMLTRRCGTTSSGRTANRGPTSPPRPFASGRSKNALIG